MVSMKRRWMIPIMMPLTYVQCVALERTPYSEIAKKAGYDDVMVTCVQIITPRLRNISVRVAVCCTTLEAGAIIVCFC